MLEVKVNDDKSVHIHSDADTKEEFITDSILAVITMATSISESTGISVKESLDRMMRTSYEAINFYKAEPETMRNMFGKEGAGDDA